ncbi:MAG: NAD(P)-dependent oxidoreductase [Thaumarchaeota archaeon]|nr:NAD(P)-dependent oxidoreductase [Nitrososphaerota archaeon]
MRIFLVGASGAIGKKLVPQLVGKGYEVVGAFRSPVNEEHVRAMGAEPVVLDLLDAAAVRKAVARTKPDAIIHQATSLNGKLDFKHPDRAFAQTNLLRTKGTDNLLAAAKEAGVRRLIAQSYASYRYERVGGPVKTEEDPLDPDPPAAMRGIYSAMNYLDRVVTNVGGVALRYGGFYGDPTSAAERVNFLEPIQKRMFPTVGNGKGYASFIHLEDAAAATVLALEHDVTGVYNIVDDEPAPAREWLPYLASVLGAKPPRHYPAWMARLFAGELAVILGEELRGASNQKAKRELGMKLRYPSWRQGFVAAYGSISSEGIGVGGRKV